MKKSLFVVFAVSIAAILLTGCPSAPPAAPLPPPQPVGDGPLLTVVMPPIFSPNPDIPNDTMTVSITVTHPVDIRDWRIQIHAPTGGQLFFEATGTGTPPAQWQWDGRSSVGQREMVQTATDYRFVLSVSDVEGASSTFEGLIRVGVILIREGNVLRIVVPSLIFSGNVADLALVDNEEYRRSNARVLSLIGTALERLPGYRITVEGHANPVFPAGTAERANEEVVLRRISEQRATAVVNYLATNHNIARNRLTAIGRGGTRTVTNPLNEAENWRNRRVEFILVR